MLIRNAEVFGRADTDVRWVGERIAECGRGLRAKVGEDEIDAGGGWLIPGLHDHHTHLRATAALAESIRLDAPPVRTGEQLTERLRQADRDLPAGAWIRGVGYHDGMTGMLDDNTAGVLDRRTLDRILRDRPVRIQHRSGALWILNSRACEMLDVDRCPLPGVERDADGRATGRLWRMDSWLAEHVGGTAPDPAQVSAAAAALGITGFTDATPGLSQSDIDRYADWLADGLILQRVHCMAPPGRTDPRTPRFTLGPTKFLLDDTALPPLDEFIAAVQSTHAAGRSVAVHCVTRVQLILTMAALDAAGVRRGDRIEHGAIIPADSIPWLREHGVPVITQPHFPVERADQYAREVPADEQPDLWRLRSLLAGGVGVAAGTDAPFGDADPWGVVRAAVHRTTDSPGPESVSLTTAVALFSGEPQLPAHRRAIEPGAPADLTLLHPPPNEVLTTPPADLIAATFVDGNATYLA
ncbi:amidohydrolase family protein [Nocardia mexicana]|uniref:Putative amidohydrolase YtcJ n=1 Tax=Nocardia mexicana TaxID=279262 RepID=A0A370GNZ3_9NOCA|nr:amidohydrolase family protein [Nocardia mexicana]RDI45059.1 putative amidohydrolase YtcJ [Nocardia mexicana]